jgi:hypothetical protein
MGRGPGTSLYSSMSIAVWALHRNYVRACHGLGAPRYGQRQEGERHIESGLDAGVSHVPVEAGLKASSTLWETKVRRDNPSFERPIKFCALSKTFLSVDDIVKHPLYIFHLSTEQPE